MVVTDVDRDGLLDIVIAAQKEYIYTTVTSVFWYQNPGGNGVGGVMREV